MIGDREISGFRRGYYELLSQLFIDAPPERLLAVLGHDLDSRIEAAAQLRPALAEGWQAIAAYLSENGGDPPKLREAVAEEHNVLFISPREPVIFPYESYYMEKDMYGPSLAQLRGFLRRAGLEKRDDFPEPEDHIACELEIIAQLIARQEGAKEPAEEERWLHLQGEFLRAHLLPWAFPVCEEVEGRQRAQFYKGVAKLARGFLQLEKEILADWGPAVPAREPAAERAERWKGPTFDLLQIGKSETVGGGEEGPDQENAGCS